MPRIDEGIFRDEPLDVTIEKLHPDTIVKSNGHISTWKVEAATLEKYGRNLFFSSGKPAPPPLK